MTPYRKHRKYDKAFKLEVLQRIEHSDRTLASIAEELGINPGIISRWRKQFKEQEKSGDGHVTTDLEEIRRLKKKLADVQEERDILKKAVAFFAKHPD